MLQNMTFSEIKAWNPKVQTVASYSLSAVQGEEDLLAKELPSKQGNFWQRSYNVARWWPKWDVLETW